MKLKLSEYLPPAYRRQQLGILCFVSWNQLTTQLVVILLAGWLIGWESDESVGESVSWWEFARVGNGSAKSGLTPITGEEESLPVLNSRFNGIWLRRATLSRFQNGFKLFNWRSSGFCSFNFKSLEETQ